MSATRGIRVLRRGWAEIGILVDAVGRLLEGREEAEVELTEPELVVYGANQPGAWRLVVTHSPDLAQVEGQGSTWRGCVADLWRQLRDYDMPAATHGGTGATDGAPMDGPCDVADDGVCEAHHRCGRP